MPRGVVADSVKFRQADFIAGVHRQCPAGAAGGRRGRRGRAVPLPAERADDVHLAHGHPAFGPAHGDRLPALGLSINTMTLGGLAIAIGELVDDAVVDVENIFRRLRENRADGQSRARLSSVVAKASQEVRSGIVYATLIVILVFVPLFALSGIEGRLFAPLGVAYIVSILARCRLHHRHAGALLLPAAAHEADGPRRRLAGARAQGRQRPRAAAGPSRARGCVVIAGGRRRGRPRPRVPFLPRAFLPPFNEGTLTISLHFQPGISLAEANALGRVAERLIMQVPEVRASAAAPAAPSSTSMPRACIPPRSTSTCTLRPRQAAMLADIRARLGVLPGGVNIGQPIGHRLDHMLSGVRAQIALKIFGDDLDTLRTLAERMRSGWPLSRACATCSSSARCACRSCRWRWTTSGRRSMASRPRRSTEALQACPAARSSARSWTARAASTWCCASPTQDRTGSRAGRGAGRDAGRPRAAVAAGARYGKPTARTRSCGRTARRRIVVLANTDGTRHGARSSRASGQRWRHARLPPGYFVALEGTFQAQEEATRPIAVLSLVSLGLIFIVLYCRYRSAVLALIIMGNVPLALVGAIAALWIAGQPLSVASHGRLHHAGRHRHAQRHPEGQPLPQPRPARGRALGASALVLRGGRSG